MRHDTTKVTFAALAAVAALGMNGLSWADDLKSGDSSNQPSAFGRSGNQGEGFTEDQTIKGPGKLPQSSPQEDARITLGGARPTVIGEVLAINGEDYTIRDQSGSEVRIHVTGDTNLDCARMGGSDSAMVKESKGQDLTSLPDQNANAQGNEQKGQSHGFVVGSKDGCSFKAGDRVKAEVSDEGKALFMKYWND